MNEISRKEARSNGLPFYFTGKKCKRGHIQKRRSDNGTCLDCIKHRDAVRQVQERDYLIEKCRKFRENNPDYAKEASRAYYKSDPEREKKRCRDYRRKNKGKVYAYNAMRRAGIGRATPSWSEKDDIQELYKKCVSMSGGTRNYHVDHIVPLNGERVSGLHVIANLRILEASKNISKRNKFIVG